MMVSETAAFAGGQASYLQQIENQLSPAGNFPLIKGVMYFDAPGKDGQNTYPMNPSGWQKFQNLSASPMFLPSRVASTVATKASPASSMVGYHVQLNAQVSHTDFGGSVSFLANGTPLPGCQPISVGPKSACTTTTTPYQWGTTRLRRFTAVTPRLPVPRRPP